jgi:hypothetical protein
MVVLRCAALFCTLPISIILHFLKGWANKVLKEHQDNQAGDNYSFCIAWLEKPPELVIRATHQCHEKPTTEAQALLIEAKRSSHPQSEIPEEALRRIWHLATPTAVPDCPLRGSVNQLFYFAPASRASMPCALSGVRHRLRTPSHRQPN